MKKHYNIIISGRVQGVFFRASTLKKAGDLGICGFVRNEMDGNVYIESEGQETALKKFIDWCHIGPPNAMVKKISVIESDSKYFTGFEIKPNAPGFTKK